MLIARAPMRISFLGGGTDLPSYYERHGGLVLSTSINKYVYVIVSARNVPSLQMISADYRMFFSHNEPQADFIWNGSLDLPKRVFSGFGFRQGLNIFIASEVPPGTGLGSSSAVAVACITAAGALRGVAVSAQQAAEMASFTEIGQLEMTIGKQDQFASAFGGLNAITFSADSTNVAPLRLPRETVARLHEHLMLFYTGTARNSSAILHEQDKASRSDGDVVSTLGRIKDAAHRGRELLEAGELEEFAVLLDASWQQKKRLARSISNPDIDRWYTIGRESGALGGKITGAGGGGFLMLFCEPTRQAAVVEALAAEGLQRMDFGFDREGARVILNTVGVDPDRQQEISPQYRAILGQ